MNCQSRSMLVGRSLVVNLFKWDLQDYYWETRYGFPHHDTEAMQKQSMIASQFVPVKCYSVCYEIRHGKGK